MVRWVAADATPEPKVGCSDLGDRAEGGEPIR